MQAGKTNLDLHSYAFSLLNRYDWVIVAVLAIFLLRKAAGEEHLFRDMAREFGAIIKLMKSMKALNALITIALCVVIVLLIGPGRFAELGAFHETNPDQEKLQYGMYAFCIVFLGTTSLISLRLCRHET